ncbi:resolvase [Clostridioides difficile]|uniref:resolvase n=1 Tax=unclassified Clostridioides TaxID=2635829 RepID=UPI00142F6AF5|nr:resolvase [Clostridioides difficile]MCC0679519.1 resolvase [Clostridioides sp. ES-S-0005-03]MCC0765067.1 resolvase [Clostridioides sp. ES-S-0006-03]MDB3084789.1 resolvase [Clostridioides difficile]NJJ35292.1 resolvase [Clostridioides difficile]
MGRIYAQKSGSLNEQDRLELLRLLGKAGYTVKIGREKQNSKTTYTYFVEYIEEHEEK